MVEEECPPPWLRCMCGEKFPLTMEEEPARSSFNYGKKEALRDEA
jgi:hypothetical protein